MGICDLFDVLRENCPDVLEEFPLEKFCGWRVSIDISIFLNKYVKTAGDFRWMENFIYLFCTLRSKGWILYPVFDGPNPPYEKQDERERRRIESQKKAEKLVFGRGLLGRIRPYAYRQPPLEVCNQCKEMFGLVLPTDADQGLKRVQRLSPSSKEERRLVRSLVAYLDGSLPDDLIEEVKGYFGTRSKVKVNYNDAYSVYRSLVELLERQEKQNLPILPDYSKQAKEVLEILGIQYYQADGEAEALCASLCVQGVVDAVLSEDSDVLAYGTPYFLCKIDLSKGKVTMVRRQNLLAGLELQYPEFVDLCILLSCDYNQRAIGYVNSKKATNIGAKKALILIREHRRLEKIEPLLINPELLKYRRCRELFTPFDVTPIEYEIAFPDIERLQSFLRSFKIILSYEFITESFRATKLIFE